VNDCTIIAPSKSDGKKKKSSASTDNSNEVEFTYLISNPGTQTVFDIVAIDDVFGELPGSPISEIAPGDSVTLSQTSEVLQSVVHSAFVSAAGANGAVCEAQAFSTVTVEMPLISCENGKPQALVFEYTGESCAMESNTQNKDECSGDTDAANGVSIVITRDADKVSASPSEGVNVGDLVTIRTTNSKFRATTELDIVGAMGTQSLNIHTSCSDDLIVGQSFGAFRLVEFIAEGGIVTSTELSE
jgi:hypothetical protein